MSESNDNAQNEERLVMPPTGPTPRPPLPRMSSIEGSETEMPHQKVKKNNSIQSAFPRSPEIRKSSQRKVQHQENYNRVSLNAEHSLDDSSDDISSEGESFDNPSSGVSYSRSPSNQKSNLRNNSSYIPECATPSPIPSPNLPFNKERYRPRNDEQDKSSFWLLSAIAIILSVVITYIYIPNSDTNNTSTDKERYLSSELENARIEQLRLDIKDVRNLFPSQKDSVWSDILIGIKDVVINPTRPSIFLLLAKEDNTVICLAKKIGTVASHALGGSESLEFTPERLEHNTGHVIENLRVPITQKKAVIFQDLLMINPGALKAFHYMCDSESPLVPEAVYLLTMRSNKYKGSQPPLKFAEQQLNNTLHSVIDQDTLQPLITRITGGTVLFIKPEENVQCP